jgi:fumarate hydratase, class I
MVRGRPKLKGVPEFSYIDLLPTGPDQTTYRRLTGDGVSSHGTFGRNFLEVEPQLLTMLTAAAMHDIAHLLRPAHLRQLRSILDDPEASPNDRYVARDLLKNACIAAGGVLPMCQDTGTAIVMGKRGQHVLTDGRDSEHIARGVYDAYTTLNLRYSQLAPLTMWEERNTGSNLPAQIEIYATGGDQYKFLFMAKGGGSANKSFLYRGLPPVPPGHRGRRDLGRVRAEDGQVRVGQVPRRAAHVRVGGRARVPGR